MVDLDPVWRLRNLRAPAKLVLCHLLYAPRTETGYAILSLEKLSRECCVRHPFAKQLLKELEAKKLIRTVEKERLMEVLL